ncbi:hypothetical protein BCR37DRAFT_375876 [Protomyces lactucae-debilis]|uniref:NAD(P)-binding protein n=1 Tax=Protomyces lactucae-debilis TaxID=2754530 RepID=A0A1Y2FWK5_PROLT|nr:uncharacterized protein BCR37DRAFT_375876 [Protomyces lactucae-debilis]ORY87917.1 hypothetical protein BCR37DRAFT_375876 [Protomyces lactucae-debilis]
MTSLLPANRFIRACKQQVAGLNLVDKTCLVVGGTNGIGKQVALTLASRGASVVVAGRSLERGSQVLEQLRNQSTKSTITDIPTRHHAFERVDLLSQRDVKRFVSSIKEKHAVDHVFLTAGKPPNGQWSSTEDGVETHFALQCLGRYSVAWGLRDTVTQGITTVCAPGGGSSCPAEDPEYRNHRSEYGFFKQAGRDSLYVDAMLLALSKQAPKLRIMHLFPGAIATTAAETAGFPWIITLLARIFSPYVMTDAAEYAHVPVAEAFGGPAGFYGRDQYGRDVSPKPWAQDATNQEKVVVFSEERIKEALSA